MIGPLLRTGTLTEFHPVGAVGHPVYLAAAQLRAALARRLGPELADTFAIPQRNEDGDTLDWYAPNPGPVVPWSAASPEERASAQAQLLANRTRIDALAAAMQTEASPERQVFAQLLAHVLSFPSEDHLYLVGGCPVVTFWGFVRDRDSVGADPLVNLSRLAAPPPVTPPVPRRAVPWWLWALPLLLLALALLYFLLRDWMPGGLPLIPAGPGQPAPSEAPVPGPNPEPPADGEVPPAAESPTDEAPKPPPTERTLIERQTGVTSVTGTTRVTDAAGRTVLDAEGRPVSAVPSGAAGTTDLEQTGTVEGDATQAEAQGDKPAGEGVFPMTGPEGAAEGTKPPAAPPGSKAPETPEPDAAAGPESPEPPKPGSDEKGAGSPSPDQDKPADAPEDQGAEKGAETPAPKDPAAEDATRPDTKAGDQPAPDQPAPDKTAGGKAAADKPADEPAGDPTGAGKGAGAKPPGAGAPGPAESAPGAGKGAGKGAGTSAPAGGGTGRLSSGWHTATSLQDPRTGLPVQMEYAVEDGAGQLRLKRHDGSLCQTPASAAVRGGRLAIESGGDIRCADGTNFGRPSIECENGKDGKPRCLGRYPNGTAFPIDVQGTPGR